MLDEKETAQKVETVMFFTEKKRVENQADLTHEFYAEEKKDREALPNLPNDMYLEDGRERILCQDQADEWPDFQAVIFSATTPAASRASFNDFSAVGPILQPILEKQEQPTSDSSFLSVAETTAADISFKKRSKKKSQQKALSLEHQLQSSSLQPPLIKSSFLALHPRLDAKRLLFLIVMLVCFCTMYIYFKPVKEATTVFVVYLSSFYSCIELSISYSVILKTENQNSNKTYLLSQKPPLVKVPCFWEIGKRLCVYDMLENNLCPAETCLSSRLLGVMSSQNLDGMTPLSPGHFLMRTVDFKTEHISTPTKWSRKEDSISKLKRRITINRRPVSNLSILPSAEKPPEHCRKKILQERCISHVPAPPQHVMAQAPARWSSGPTNRLFMYFLSNS